MFTLRDSVVVFAFALFLTACGGDQLAMEEDSSTTSTSTVSSTTTEEPATLEGRAVKGLVLNAQLDAYILENGSRRHVGSTQTDDQGHYSLQLSDSSGPVVIEMTPVGDGSSTMICDATDGCGTAGFGQEFPLPTDFFISTLIIPSDDTSEVSITPLTHLAAEWAQAMPGTVTDQHVKLARARVAGVFQIDTAFMFHNEPDITDPQSLDAATEAAARHSLISAAFLERAADTDDTLQDVINGYTQSLADYAGQIENHGTYSLYNLFDAAYEIANTQDILPDIRSSLDLQIAGLGDGISRVDSTTSYTQQDFDNALTTLDELDYYLNEAGVDGTGNFFANQTHQLDWLYNRETMGLIYSSLDTSMATAAASVMAGLYEGRADKPDTLDMSYLIGGDSSAVYDFSTQQLTVTGQANGQTHNLTIDITPVTSDKQVFNYAVQGDISSDVSTASVNGTLELDFFATDLQPMMSTLEELTFNADSTTLTVEDQKQELKNLVESAHYKATLNGTASVVKATDQNFGFEFNQISVARELNSPYLNDGGNLFVLDVDTGEVITPDGDKIFDNANTTAPGLSLQVGDTSQMDADFVTQAFGLPRMEVQAQGTLKNAGTLIDMYASDMQALLDSDNRLSGLLEMIPGVDLSVLDLSGSVNLTIDDPDRGQKVFDFTVENTRVDASQPNSTDAAFSFHGNGAQGGYITSGGTLVGTVTFHGSEFGAVIHLVDGTKRSYFLGPLDDLISPQAQDAFNQIFG